MIPKIKISGTKQQHHPVVVQEASDASSAGTHGVFHENRRSARWSARRRRDAWLLLVVLLLGLGTVLVLSSIGATLKKQTNATQPGTLPTMTVGAAGRTPVPTVFATVRVGKTRIYPLPPPVVGLMQPAVDSQGNVWVGEMVANRLARLDSHTGVIRTWQPPDARYGIMTTTVDRQGNVWFVEQGANYIGRFDPVQQTFRIFPLGTVRGHRMGPQDLRFDASGKLWFTVNGPESLRLFKRGMNGPTFRGVMGWGLFPPALPRLE